MCKPKLIEIRLDKSSQWFLLFPLESVVYFSVDRASERVRQSIIGKAVAKMSPKHLTLKVKKENRR